MISFTVFTSEIAILESQRILIPYGENIFLKDPEISLKIFRNSFHIPQFSEKVKLLQFIKKTKFILNCSNKFSKRPQDFLIFLKSFDFLHKLLVKSLNFRDFL